MDVESYVLSRAYTKASLIGLGALRGAPCQVESYEFDEDGNTILHLKWVDSNWNTKRSTAVVNRGLQGLQGLQGEKGIEGEKGDKGDMSNVEELADTPFDYRLKFTGLDGEIETSNLKGSMVFFGEEVNTENPAGQTVEVENSKLYDVYMNTETCKVYRRTDKNPITGTTVLNHWVLEGDVKGDEGLNAYETWLTIPGNEGKTIQQWVEETSGASYLIQKVWEKPNIQDEETLLNVWYMYKTGTVLPEKFVRRQYKSKTKITTPTLNTTFKVIAVENDVRYLLTFKSPVAVPEQSEDFAYYQFDMTLNNNGYVFFNEYDANDGILSVTPCTDVTLTVMEDDDPTVADFEIEVINNPNGAWLHLSTPFDHDLVAHGKYSFWNGVTYTNFELAIATTLPTGIIRAGIWDEKTNTITIWTYVVATDTYYLAAPFAIPTFTSANVPEGYTDMSSFIELNPQGRWFQTIYISSTSTKEDANEVTVETGVDYSGIVTIPYYNERVGTDTLHTESDVVRTALNELNDIIRENVTDELDTDEQTLIGAINELEEYKVDVEQEEEDVDKVLMIVPETVAGEQKYLVKPMDVTLGTAPTGAIMAWPGPIDEGTGHVTLPVGWLVCDGRAVSRTQYRKLYKKIGITYGNGDGSTTFNLPNLSNRFIEGAAENDTKLNQKISAGIPNIKGESGLPLISPNAGTFVEPTGALSGTTTTHESGFPDGTIPRYREILKFDASKGTFDKSGNKIAQANSPYGNADTVQPASIRMVYIICTGDATPDNIVDTMYLAGAEDDEAETIKFGKDDLGKYGYYKHNDDHFIPFIDPNEVNQVYQLLGEGTGWGDFTLSKSVNEYDACYVDLNAEKDGFGTFNGAHYHKFIGKESYGEFSSFDSFWHDKDYKFSIKLEDKKVSFSHKNMDRAVPITKVYGVKFEAECEPPVQMKLYTNPLDEIEFGEVNGVYGFRIEGTEDLIPFGKDSNKGDMDYDVLYTGSIGTNGSKNVELANGINNYDAILLSAKIQTSNTNHNATETQLVPRNEYNDGAFIKALFYISGEGVFVNFTDYSHAKLIGGSVTNLTVTLNIYGITYKANCSFATEVKLTTDDTKSIKFDEEDDHYGYIDNDGVFHAFGSGGGMPDDTAWREPKSSDTGKVGVVRNTVFQQINDLPNADVSYFNGLYPYHLYGLKAKLNGVEHVFYNRGYNTLYEFNPITGIDTSKVALTLDENASNFHPIQIGDEVYGIISYEDIKKIYFDETTQTWKTKRATEMPVTTSLKLYRGLVYEGYLFVPGGEYSGSGDTYVTDWYRSTLPVDDWDLDDSSFVVSFEKIGEAVPSPYFNDCNNRSDRIVMDSQGRVALATYSGHKYIVYQLSVNQAPQYVGTFELNLADDESSSNMFIKLAPDTYFYVDKNANMLISNDFTTGEWETLVDENGDPLHLITPKEFNSCTFTLNGTYYFTELTSGNPKIGDLLHSTKPNLYLSWEDYSGGGGGEPMTDEEIEDAFEESPESSTLMEKVLDMIYPIGTIVYGAKPTLGNWNAYTSSGTAKRYNMTGTDVASGNGVKLITIDDMFILQGSVQMSTSVTQNTNLLKFPSWFNITTSGKVFSYVGCYNSGDNPVGGQFECYKDTSTNEWYLRYYVSSGSGSAHTLTASHYYDFCMVGQFDNSAHADTAWIRVS